MPGLKKYGKKRRFDGTPEPKPKKVKKAEHQARYCIQKHKARRLHYDLRLELDGVLLSWAVPKGPSMDPHDKRLAIHVEDHPLDYIDFEGVIPAGNYGAGVVAIWDKGTYIAEEKAMREGLKKGHLRFFLKGKKLKGEFALVKMKGREDNSWLLFKVEDDSPNDALPNIKKSKMPQWISPMLANVADEPFDSADWLFEIKWDGYRALAFLDRGRVKLLSRNQKSFNTDYPQLVKELKKLDVKAILDGEVVVLDENGVSRFELLQGCKDNPECNLHYMIFDLMYLNGYDLRAFPLIKRKELLKELLAHSDSDMLHLGDHVEKKGIKLFDEAQKNGLEGLIAKLKDSKYLSARSSDWLKIKTALEDEFIIGGFTKPRKSRSYFGSLLLGVFSNGHLRFVGHVGTGFTKTTLEELMKKMKPLIRKKCPFEEPPPVNEPATWLKPKLVAEVTFAEKTARGILRQPVFHGLRSDKSAQDVKEQRPALVASDSASRSNLDKVFWQEEGYTKGDMLAYYETIAPFILPHLKGRPLTLRRLPDGIDGQEFYQKNIEKPPPWLKTALIEHKSKTKKKRDRQAVVEDARSLLYIANLASIEIHPMLVRVGRLTHPDYLVIDLDPEALPFKKVVEAARAAHSFFNELNLPNFCKTSGGRGLHIYIPLGARFSSEQSLRLSELFAYFIRDMLPSLISLERMPAKRQKHVYIDFLQNAEKKTMVAPYSLRALPHAPVSTPLKWSEVKEGLDPLDFTIRSIPKRVKKLGDIFAPVLEQSEIDLKMILKQLEKRA